MAKRVKPTSIRAKKHKTGDRGEKLLEDWISGLPNEILVYILSLLTMKEAGRTSVLSKRWRYIWTSIPCLNFDASQILDELLLGSKLLKVERPVHVSWVNQVVKSYEGSTIDEFRVRFDLDESCGNDIDSWVKFAMEKRVQRLELILSNYWAVAQNKCCTLPDMCGIINQLHRPPNRYLGCNPLTSLQLASVNVTGEVLQYFLSNCPFLERLSVEGSNSLVNLKVDGPSLNLKFLEIYLCFEVKTIEISAPNLVSFNYVGPKISMPFNYIPKLVEISVGGDYCEYLTYNFLELSSYLSQLERLTLQMNRIKKNMEFVKFPIFTKLKQLELSVTANDDESLLGFTPLINAAPFLYKFALQLDWCEPDFKRKRLKAAACPHHCLKVVEFVGFVGHTIDVELFVYLIKNAVSLEKIILDSRKPYHVGTPWEFEDTKEKRTARKHAKQLGTKLPPGAALVIL